MKEFFKRAGIFAILNAVIIGLLFLFNGRDIPDHNILYGTLASLVIGCLYEPYMAVKHGRRPSVETFGAAIFGTIAMGALILVILMIAGIV